LSRSFSSISYNLKAKNTTRRALSLAESLISLSIKNRRVVHINKTGQQSTKNGRHVPWRSSPPDGVCSRSRRLRQTSRFLPRRIGSITTTVLSSIPSIVQRKIPSSNANAIDIIDCYQKGQRDRRIPSLHQEVLYS
jgi:hypothetical protein